MRLKLSFDDITMLFRYLDSDGTGEIGYDQFTMLLEERWRNLDPYRDKTNQGIQRKLSLGAPHTSLDIYSGCTNYVEAFEKLENLANNRTKIPLKKGKYNHEGMNINRENASDLLERAATLPVQGKLSDVNPIMGNVLKHDYMRRSMEQRV